MSCPSHLESSKDKTRNIHTLPPAHKGRTINAALKVSLGVWTHAVSPARLLQALLSAPNQAREAKGSDSDGGVRKTQRALHPTASRCPPLGRGSQTREKGRVLKEMLINSKQGEKA